MRHWITNIVVLGVLLSMCGCGPHGDPEGACAAPGVSCGGVFCSLDAFCQGMPDGGLASCVPERGAGQPCAAPNECSSLQCVDGGCVGEPVPCDQKRQTIPDAGFTAG